MNTEMVTQSECQVQNIVLKKLGILIHVGLFSLLSLVS